MMKSRASLIQAIIYLALLILLGACWQPESPWQGTIEEVDGVTIVKNPQKPLKTELQILFEEDLTIGVEEGDENYMFGNQVFVNADDDGNIYVTDWDRTTVRKYDSDGNFLHSIGRPGQGPGEFQDISEVRFDNDGNIYLYDVKNRRISYLTKDGDYLKGIRVPIFFERVVINSRGFFAGRSADNVELKGGKEWDYFYGLFDENFNLITEFFRQHQEADFKSSSNSPAQMIADYLSGIAFQPNINYVLDKNDLLYFGYAEAYEIKVYSPDGTLLKRIQRDFEPREISGKDKKYFEQNQSKLLDAKMPAGEEEKIFELVEYPEYKPAYERFALMENGWIFVVVDSANGGNTLVDIFGKEGEYLGQFETDISTDWLSFNNGKAYTVTTINDYKYIKRYNFKILGY